MSSNGQWASSSADWARQQAEQFEASNGQQANTANGLPIVLLTSTGARSGKPRKSPLMRVENQGQYVLVGSKEGATTDPAWVHNLRADPRVQLQDGTDRHTYLAQELAGEQREQWWRQAVQVYPTYTDYQSRTTRLIPVFLLTRTDA